MPKDKDEELQRLNDELLEEDIAPAEETDVAEEPEEGLLTEAEVDALLDEDTAPAEPAAEETPKEKPDRTIKFLSVLALCLAGGILVVLALLLWEFRGLWM